MRDLFDKNKNIHHPIASKYYHHKNYLHHKD